MRIAIVDDESVFRKQIESSITSLYGKGEVSCFHYADGSELIAAFRNGFELDAVFLDIEMKDMDGMETARQIRSFLSDIPVIFLTSHTEMAIAGYEVSAFRFLSKPVDMEKLRETLKDLEKKIRIEEKIVLKVDGEDVVYPVSLLVYAEAANNCVRFVFTEECAEIRMKFSDAIALIDSVSGDFFKCHRSYYINLGRVKKIGSADASMDNGDSIPISRGLAAQAKQKLFEYIRRNGR
ncbi:MAG: LytTR family DNA-binding domain-containing protein [Lachnospiraceae bacterium]|nr:LytTR family DNA-binding domain-containing protein [Lachnospiraceae bacterium]